MDEAGIVIEESESEPEEEQTVAETIEQEATSYGYEDYLLEELEDLLQKAIEEENYEEASRIRDEIKRRKETL